MLRNGVRSGLVSGICEGPSRPRKCGVRFSVGPNGLVGGDPTLLTFKRASTRRYMNSAGWYDTGAIDEMVTDYGPDGVKPGVTLLRGTANKLLHAATFQNAVWTATGCTPTDNIGTSLGAASETAAARIVEDSSTGIHGMKQTTASTLGTGAYFHIAVWVEFVGRDWIQVFSSLGGVYLFAKKDGTIGDVSGISGAKVINTSDPDIKIVTGYFNQAAATATTDVSFRSATGGTIGDESYTGDGSSITHYLWGAIIAPGPFGGPIISTATSDATSDDLLTIDTTKSWTKAMSRIVVDCDLWVFPINGELLVFWNGKPELTNSFSFFKTATDVLNYIVYDSAGAFVIDAYDMPAAFAWGDHFRFRNQHVQGNQIDSVKYNGASIPRTAVSGAGTDNWTSAPSTFELHQTLTARKANMKLYSVEVG